ncbi:MAG: LAGLIDADG family homing endonuclease, partial [Longimicrobiales bacterium]
YSSSKDPEEVADFVASAEAFPNVRCTVADHKGTASVYAARVHRKDPPGIFTWAGDLGLLGKKATEKEVPAAAFALGPDQIALLLSRMWAGDGHINVKGRSLYYATASRKLAHQVQHLLARLRIISRIRTVFFPYRGSEKIGFQVFVTGHENLRKFADTVGTRFLGQKRRTDLSELAEEIVVSEAVKDLIPVDVRDHVRLLKANGGHSWAQVEAGAGVTSRDFYPLGTNPGKIGFTRKMIGSLGAFFHDERLSCLAESHVLWDRVVSIEPVGETRTYDLEVPGHHNFVADDFIVHNSHSAAYSLLSYHTAWLKAHYPAEFMAALLSSVLDKTDDVVKYIGECRELHKHLPGVSEPLEVLPPDVNESGWKFTVVDENQIRFGLGAVRGVGSGAVSSVIRAREEKGPFTTLFDFLERIDLRLLNKRAAEALIAAGALDAFGHRGQLLAGLDVAYAEVQARQAEEEAGQASLFGGADAVLRRPDPELPRVPEWSEGDRLTREKEALGFYISGHPLDRYRPVVEAFAPVNTSTLKSYPGQPVELACVVTQVTRQVSRKDSSEWAKLLVEDFSGTATVLAFKDSWQGAKEILQQDAVVLIRGKVSGRERDEEDPPVFLDGAELLEAVPASGRLAVQIELEFGGLPREDAFAAAREVMARHPGVAPVEVVVETGNGLGAPRFRSRTLRVAPDSETLRELEGLFGPGHVRLVRTSQNG